MTHQCRLLPPPKAGIAFALEFIPHSNPTLLQYVLDLEDKGPQSWTDCQISSPKDSVLRALRDLAVVWWTNRAWNTPLPDDLLLVRAEQVS